MGTEASPGEGGTDSVSGMGGFVAALVGFIRRLGELLEGVRRVDERERKRVSGRKVECLI